VLVRGDRRDFVVISCEGEVFGLRGLAGKCVKDFCAKLGGATELPSVTEATQQIVEDMKMTFQRHIAAPPLEGSHDFKNFTLDIADQTGTAALCHDVENGGCTLGRPGGTDDQMMDLCPEPQGNALQDAGPICDDAIRLAALL